MSTPSLSVTPISRSTVAEQVKQQLLEMIKSGHLRPGTRLPAERVLSEQFNVARTSVREAMQGLAALGLIERRGNRTYVVEHLTDLNLEQLHDDRKLRIQRLFEARQIIEVHIGELAACRASEADRRAISDIAATFTPRMPLEEFRQRDREFHGRISQACGNDFLAEIYGKVLEALFESETFETLLSAGANRSVVRRIIKQSGEAHHAIAVAITSGDPVTTVEAVRDHLQAVEEDLINNLV